VPTHKNVAKDPTYQQAHEIKMLLRVYHRETPVGLVSANLLVRTIGCQTAFGPISVLADCHAQRQFAAHIGQS
jgi:hypothetical protein